MSNLVKCLFFYGPGEVVVNEHGADLGEFRWSELELSDPETWSISQLKDWLAACLGLNPQTDTVGVHALWTKTRSPVFFYLRPIERTSQMVRSLQGCASRGCTPHALLIPIAKEVIVPEGEGGHDPGQSS